MTTPPSPGRIDRTPPLPPSLLDVKIHESEARQAVHGDATRVEVARRYHAGCARLTRDGALGHPSREQLRDLHDRLTARLHTEITAGATVHRRVPALIRCLPWTVALLDGLVLYTFCADVFNVPTAELSRSGLAALSLAILGSGITYAWLSLTGSRLRDYRTALGELCWRQTRALTWGLLAGAAVVTVTLAVLMYERVAEQAGLAGPGYVAADQVGVLAWVFAILSGCANLAVVVVHALDGSTLGAHARHAGRALHRADRRLEGARRRAWRRAVRARPGQNPLDDDEGERQVVTHIA